LSDFVACFIPIFVAANVMGILPTFVGMTADYSVMARKRIAIQASFTALAIGLVFVLLGKSIFTFLGISIFDFQIAGGILLFLFAIRDLTVGHKGRRTIHNDESVGVVPIGMPLIAGPGVLTSLLLLEAKYGLFLTVLNLVLNIFIVFIVFHNSQIILKVMGKAGSTAFGKLFSIFLAAIGISLIRTGITSFVESL